ncbi:tRNA epoxyqueuosine(34) reductase QueG [Aliiglaciecola litoralis]|uniref:Epoxyqueuosine reductase n=1 Tax=Aliiglaciecola litoralis TaxID=582857 RepID=A0ABN1LSZ9_9ALTE
MTHFTPQFLDQLSQNIKEWGKALGFQQVGICDTDVSAHQAHLQNWIEKGYHGDMAFFERNQEKRIDPAELLPGTCRVISVRMDYLPPDASFATDLKRSEIAYISRYAHGRDYHKLVRNRLKQLGQKIAQQFEGLAFRPFVDSAPVLEHALAEKAGLGWTGKHTLTINESAGSWFFLGELFVNIPLPIDQPVEEKCGTCTACLTICPTGAIVAPYQVDARKCISYLTIEHDSAIPEQLRPLMGNRIYGCDDCQLICPWNRYANLTEESDFFSREGMKSEKLITLFSWDETAFLHNTEGSPIRRIGFQKWQRNIAVALGNADYDQRIVELLNNSLPHASPLVAEHIQWAIEQQTQRAQQATDTSIPIRLRQRLVRSIDKGLPRDA